MAPLTRAAKRNLRRSRIRKDKSKGRVAARDYDAVNTDTIQEQVSVLNYYSERIDHIMSATGAESHKSKYSKTYHNIYIHIYI